MKKHFYNLLIINSLSFFLLCSCQEKNLTTIIPVDEASIQADKINLGKKIFFDTNLSSPARQSCASCHSPETAFSDPAHRIISGGAVEGLFGNRNAPNLTYAMYSPALHYSDDDETYIGGYFLDGRANSLEEQAQKPFLNPLEMNNSSALSVVQKLKKADYYPLFVKIYGEISDSVTVFQNIADALAAYERSSELNTFTSKYDYFLKGQAILSDQELRGLKIFKDTLKGKCANCHPTDADATSGKVLFTDFTYDNIGVPKNTDSPFLFLAPQHNPSGQNYIDLGLGAILKIDAENGKFKVPSLRNVALTAPYFHNGYFKTLDEVVHFYNARDVENFQKPEYSKTVNHDELGNLKLSKQEEQDLIFFLKTLSDGYKK